MTGIEEPTRYTNVQMYANKVRIGGEFVSFPYAPGDQLPNGAVLIAERAIEIGDMSNGLPNRKSIVLALNHGTYEPFVVWKREVAVERTANREFRVIEACFSGDYYTSLGNAAVAWEERA